MIAILTLLTSCILNPDAEMYVGVVKQKLYHVSTCSLVGLHEDMSEITHFTSKEAARVAGYRPCKICKP
jgi:methylphosphotriester-DNA--protein-cysteine methyltransferase